MINKYRNKKTTIDGITFDSAKEARHYSQLKLLQRAGEISELEMQKSFSIDINGVRVCRYVADFCYVDKNGQQVVEDVKGMTKGAAWSMFRLKQKLMIAVLGIEVRVV